MTRAMSGGGTLCLAVIALLAPLPLRAGDMPPLPRFVAEAGGVSHSYDGDWQYMVGGGVAVMDCNGDALPDLAFAGGSSAAALYVNTGTPGGPLSFAKAEGALDLDAVTGIWPLDVDADGLTDLAVLRVGGDVLLRGTGECRFAPANDLWSFDGRDGWSTAFAATWEAGADWPTLAVGDYVDRFEEAFPWGSCTDNALYRPKPGGGGFAPALPLTPSFCALSILFTDWNRSGQPSLRVSNDREYYKGGQEQLWHLPPDGQPRLYTPDEGWQRLRIWGMGIASADLGGDGYPDYFLTSMADNKLQVLVPPAEGADPAPRYADIAFKSGVTAHRPFTGGDLRPSTAWHAQIEDVNNDGLPDLFVAKGNVSAMPDFAQADPNNLFLRRADGTFAEAADKAGVLSYGTARGGALADLNGDGWLDMVVVNRNAPAELWRNTGTAEGGGWIALDLALPGANRNAIGALIDITPKGGTTWGREATVGGGHGSGVLLPLHFGLGAAPSATVRVTWPGGAVDTFDLVSGHRWRLSPGAEPIRVAAP